jgi:hypothetical protein
MKLAQRFAQTLVIVSVLWSLSACHFQPDWYLAGKWNYAHQQYSLALPQLLWAAQRGDSGAQYAVGYMYYNGLGTPKDDILAYHWFQKASQAGNASATQALQVIQGNPMPALPSAPAVKLQPTHIPETALAALEVNIPAPADTIKLPSPRNTP